MVYTEGDRERESTRRKSKKLERENWSDRRRPGQKKMRGRLMSFLLLSAQKQICVIDDLTFSQSKDVTELIYQSGNTCLTD